MFQFDLHIIDWNAISAIISFLMVIATFLTLFYNQKRLREENRARLNFRIITYNHAYFLEIYNSGKKDAYDVNLTINEDFLEQLPDDAVECFRSILSTFYVKSNDSIFLYIGFCEKIINLWKDKDLKILINGKYNNSYKINEILITKQFIGKINMVVRTPLEHAIETIAEGLVKPNTLPKHQDIQHSVQCIAKELQKISNSLQKTENDTN